MATCKYCKKPAVAKVVEALSFECECGHKWLHPKKDKLETKLKIGESNG